MIQLCAQMRRFGVQECVDRNQLLVFVTLLILLSIWQSGWSQSDSDTHGKEVLAKVGDWQITRASVDRYIKNVVPGRRLTPEVVAKLSPAALNNLIKRQIILDYLETISENAGPNEIKLELSLLEKELEKVGRSIDDHLDKHQISLPELENEVNWKISWRRYLKKTLTDSNLEKFYKMNPRRYDGTRIKVAHILFQGTSDKIRQRAVDVKTEIVNGRLSWEKAVQAFSDATSSIDKQGVVGWIEVDKPMPPEFTMAAFILDPGQISEPVETGLGIHVIKCLELEPGNRGPLDSRETLVREATKFLFEKLSADHLPKVGVQRF